MSVVAKYLNCLGSSVNSPPGKETLQRHTEVEFLNISVNIPYPTIPTLNFSYFFMSYSASMVPNSPTQYMQILCINGE